MTIKSSSAYVNDARRAYSLYVLTQRAIPAITDGLKSAARRLLWTARNKGKTKSATLAGATMPIHPHAQADGTINTLTAPYINNHPLFDGHGTFGTLLSPTECGASRYTSVEVSEFTKAIIFKDIDLIPMMENYDSTIMEPKHFLPLVPMVLVNPAKGIAIGYATSIAPRSLRDIIDAQLAFLSNKKIHPITPQFLPNKSKAVMFNDKLVFKGQVKRINTTLIRITKIPFGTDHANIVTNEKSKLNTLLENDRIVDYIDHSKDTFNIEVKFKRKDLAALNDDALLKLLGLIVNVNENLNVLDFDHNSILQTNDVEIIEKFTTWRLAWYVDRYTRLANITKADIQQYKDILQAIKHKAGHQALSMATKAAFEAWLKSIDIINTKYISALPTYRYTAEEHAKTKKALTKSQKELTEYAAIIRSPVKRRNIYKNELLQIQKLFT